MTVVVVTAKQLTASPPPGTIPSTLTSLVKLTTLDLGSTSVSGPHEHVVVLILSSNGDTTGTLPPQIGRMAALQSLTLSRTVSGDHI